MLCRPHISHHTSFMSIFSPVFYYLGRRNASRIFQMQLCVFGKGNQVLLKIMICRLWCSYSGLIGNKMFFLLSAIKILARKTMHWSTVILHCQFSQLLMRWVLRVITCSLVTALLSLASIIALPVTMFQFFLWTQNIPFSSTLGWVIIVVCINSFKKIFV